MSRVNFTAPRVHGFECPQGRAQAFLWDSVAPGLALRVTAKGARAYVFQGEYQGSTVRITIGSPDVWPLESVEMKGPDGSTYRRMGCRDKARELQGHIDAGRDPRAVKAETVAADVARRRRNEGERVIVGDVWPIYMEEGKPRGKEAWKPRYVADLQKAAAPGGLPKKRGKGQTKPGHLWPLMGLRLVDIDADVIRGWYGTESKRAPVQAARAVAMFSGFLGWCAKRKEYRHLVDRDCARRSQLADMLPATKRRTDAIEESQLAAWFRGADKLASRTARAYLQALVLTGARREELAGLRWADVDFRWKKVVIADKVGTTRTVPMAPYLEALIAGLPRVAGNPFVFTSPTSASGRIAEPRAPHVLVLADAAIPHVSIHGLRRTFALMGEAAGAPAGAIAQIMGHRPSAVAEGYKPRSIDALRGYLTKIEAFILDRAGMVQPAPKESGVILSVVGGVDAR